MKKILVIFFMLLGITCKAQIDTTGRSDLALLFQNLNPSNIPTGYLMEWGTDMADKDDLNGVIKDINYLINAPPSIAIHQPISTLKKTNY